GPRVRHLDAGHEPDREAETERRRDERPGRAAHVGRGDARGTGPGRNAHAAIIAGPGGSRSPADAATGTGAPTGRASGPRGAGGATRSAARRRLAVLVAAPAPLVGHVESVAERVPDDARLDAVLERLRRRAVVEGGQHLLADVGTAQGLAEHLVDQLEHGRAAG